LYFVSNSRKMMLPMGSGSPGVTLLTKAKKPFGPVPYLLESIGGPGSSIIVIGDQPLTDGLLAWALQGRFISLVLPGPEPRWPAFQRFIGTLLLPLFVKRGSIGN
jgi:hypothetical protein